MKTDSMNCLMCCLKHIACALSYGKEIINGHGKDSFLDHRIDFLGQLVNLEHHLCVYNRKYALDIRDFRESLQNRLMMPTNEDLDNLRKFYLTLQSRKPEITEANEQKLNSTPAILFLSINEKEYFDLCYNMIRNKFLNYSSIYYLNSNIDLSEYKIQKINYDDIKESYVVLFKNQKSIPLNVIDYSFVQPLIYGWNYPSLVQKNKFKPYLETKNIQQYAKDNNIRAVSQSHNAFKLDKQLCCSNKTHAMYDKFCYVQNEEALKSLKDFLYSKQKILK